VTESSSGSFTGNECHQLSRQDKYFPILAQNQGWMPLAALRQSHGRSPQSYDACPCIHCTGGTGERQGVCSILTAAELILRERK